MSGICDPIHGHTDETGDRCDGIYVNDGDNHMLCHANSKHLIISPTHHPQAQNVCGLAPEDCTQAVRSASCLNHTRRERALVSVTIGVCTSTTRYNYVESQPNVYY